MHTSLNQGVWNKTGLILITWKTFAWPSLNYAKLATSAWTNCFFTLNWKGLNCEVSFPRTHFQLNDPGWSSEYFVILPSLPKTVLKGPSAGTSLQDGTPCKTSVLQGLELFLASRTSKYVSSQKFVSFSHFVIQKYSSTGSPCREIPG